LTHGRLLLAGIAVVILLLTFTPMPFLGSSLMHFLDATAFQTVR